MYMTTERYLYWSHVPDTLSWFWNMEGLKISIIELGG